MREQVLQNELSLCGLTYTLKFLSALMNQRSTDGRIYRPIPNIFNNRPSVSATYCFYFLGRRFGRRFGPTFDAKDWIVHQNFLRSFFLYKIIHPSFLNFGIHLFSMKIRGRVTFLFSKTIKNFHVDLEILSIWETRVLLYY